MIASAAVSKICRMGFVGLFECLCLKFIVLVPFEDKLTGCSNPLFGINRAKVSVVDSIII